MTAEAPGADGSHKPIAGGSTPPSATSPGQPQVPEIQGEHLPRQNSGLDDLMLSHVCCGLAFDHGREVGNLELRQVLLDQEMLRNCDDRAREAIRALREENQQLRARLRIEGGMERGQRGLGSLFRDLFQETQGTVGQRFLAPIVIKDGE